MKEKPSFHGFINFIRKRIISSRYMKIIYNKYQKYIKNENEIILQYEGRLQACRNRLRDHNGKRVLTKQEIVLKFLPELSDSYRVKLLGDIRISDILQDIMEAAEVYENINNTNTGNSNHQTQQKSRLQTYKYSQKKSCNKNYPKKGNKFQKTNSTMIKEANIVSTKAQKFSGNGLIYKKPDHMKKDSRQAKSFTSAKFILNKEENITSREDLIDKNQKI